MKNSFLHSGQLLNTVPLRINQKMEGKIYNSVGIEPSTSGFLTVWIDMTTFSLQLPACVFLYCPDIKEVTSKTI